MTAPPARGMTARMQRRQFTFSSGLAMFGAAGVGATSRAFAQSGSPKAEGKPGGKDAGKTGAVAARPEIYELRAYRMRIGAQPKLVGDYLSELYIPLATRLGAGPVGVFNLTFGPGMPTIYVLTPCASLAAYEALQAELAAELPRSKLPGAAAFYNATAHDPAYLRSDNQLLVAFDSFRKLELPATTAKREPRIFELRVYETPTDLALAKKTEMFGPKLGELDIFRRDGLTPVLFAKILVGPQQPGLVYLLSFPDLAAREAAWKRFREDPAWQKLKTLPGYLDAEIMANVTDFIVTPTAYSQI